MPTWLKKIFAFGCPHRWAFRNACPVVTPEGRPGLRYVMRCEDCGAIKFEGEAQ